MAIVYQHRRKDSNEVFYIGIGKNKNRAYIKTKRNKHWNNIVKKCDYEVDILIEECSWEQACEIEKYLIADYGRADLGLGGLVNMTNGGEGLINPSKLIRQKIANSKIGTKQSKETIEKIIKSKKGKKGPNKNRKLDSEWKNNISVAMIGKNKGKNHIGNLSRFGKKNIGRASWNKGLEMKEETIIKMKKTFSNKPKIKCEYCKIQTNNGNYYRWHGENCKQKI
jgi:hypothetical protein